MRELNTGGHKLRRPSFSNTLCELPEVEEPAECGWGGGGDDPCHVIGSSTSFKVLPPIANEDMSPSPRPRFNTIPEGVTERPKYLGKPSMHRANTKHPHPANGRLAQRHSYPGRAPHVQILDPELSGPHKRRMSKRKKSSDPTKRRPSLSSDTHIHDAGRRDSVTIPPIQRCSDVTTPSPDNKPNMGNNNKDVLKESKDSNNSVEQDHKSETVDNKDVWNKDLEVVRWRKALDKAKGESPNGSFENLARSVLSEDSYRNRRRYSMPLEQGWDRRLSNPAFADTSRKVEILLKYGKAVRNKYRGIVHHSDKSVPAKAIRTLADFMVEMPKKPRFSSFMSPQAQFSLMKGYEDKLYRKLSASLPEYNPLLKRNRTPKNTSVDIKPRNTLGFLDDSDDEEDDEYNDDDNNDDVKTENGQSRSGDKRTSSSFLTEIDDGRSNLQSSPPSVKTDFVGASSEPQYSDTKTVLRSLRRLSISLDKSSRASINKPFHEEYEDDEEADICSTLATRQRSHSMPSVSSVPFQRRLMMSYRLQSAMDILDSIKSGEDAATLSPRVKVKGGTNLAEYNAWVADWNKEFCLKN